MGDVKSSPIFSKNETGGTSALYEMNDAGQETPPETPILSAE